MKLRIHSFRFVFFRLLLSLLFNSAACIELFAFGDWKTAVAGNRMWRKGDGDGMVNGDGSALARNTLIYVISCDNKFPAKVGNRIRMLASVRARVCVCMFVRPLHLMFAFSFSSSPSSSS